MINEPKTAVVACETINAEILNIGRGVAATGWVRPDEILYDNVLLFIKKASSA